MKRLFAYSVACTMASALGVLVVGLLVRAAAGDTDPVSYVSRLIGTAVAAAPVFAGIAVLYCVAVALVAGAIRGTQWWVGALAAGLPTVVLSLILNWGIGGPAYVGTPEQLNALVLQSYATAALLTLWSAGAGAVLIGLILSRPTRNVRTR